MMLEDLSEKELERLNQWWMIVQNANMEEEIDVQIVDYIRQDWITKQEQSPQKNAPLPVGNEELGDDK